MHLIASDDVYNFDQDSDEDEVEEQDRYRLEGMRGTEDRINTRTRLELATPTMRYIDNFCNKIIAAGIWVLIIKKKNKRKLQKVNIKRKTRHGKGNKLPERWFTLQDLYFPRALVLRCASPG